MLRGEGVVGAGVSAGVESAPVTLNPNPALGGITSGQGTTRYLKLAPTSHPSHVPRH